MSRKKTDRIPVPHAGETLREALELRVPATRLTEIVHGRRGITADTALRLARYFNTTPKLWLNLQTSYDLAMASEAKAREIERAIHPREAA